MKRCPQCGETFPQDGNFCPMDGTGLVAAASAPATGGQAPAGPPPISIPPIKAGEPATAPAPAGQPVIHDRFVLGASLGGGLSGEVFQAQDRQSGRDIALKLVNPAVLAAPATLERTQRDLRQLVRVTS